MTTHDAVKRALCDHLSTGSPLPPWESMMAEAKAKVAARRAPEVQEVIGLLIDARRYVIHYRDMAHEHPFALCGDATCASNLLMDINHMVERIREQARRDRIAEALEVPEIARVVFAARVVLNGGGTEPLDELRAAVAIAEDGGV